MEAAQTCKERSGSPPMRKDAAAYSWGGRPPGLRADLAAAYLLTAAFFSQQTIDSPAGETYSLGVRKS